MLSLDSGAQPVALPVLRTKAVAQPHQRTRQQTLLAEEIASCLTPSPDTPRLVEKVKAYSSPRIPGSLGWRHFPETHSNDEGHKDSEE